MIIKNDISKRALTKNVCHTLQILAVKGVAGLSPSVKIGKFVMKIFFSDNVE